MHSIIFARQGSDIRRFREVRVTEKVRRDGVSVYSRRRSYYKLLLDEIKIPVNELKIKPELYIYKNIQGKRKFLRWKMVGIVKIPKSRNRSCLLAYEHSFWILITEND
ncbi:MAG TPA: hypothetical protein ENF97_01850 [Candidatus Omnitrophica bacterium]|nr:hypothetical protein [Candidatus Omnitrophota bacterium]